MKKLFVFSIALFCFILSVSAQEKPSVKDNLVGLHVGTGMSAIYNETRSDVYFMYDDYNQKFITVSPYITGYSFGLSYKSFMEKSAGITIELNYVTKGGYNNFYYDMNHSAGDSIYVLFKQSLKYIEIPVLTNIRVGKKNGKLNFYGGPHISYLIKQSMVFLENSYGRNFQVKTGNKFDFGLDGGLGYSYTFGKNTVEMIVKYSHSLSNIYEQQTINKSFLSQNQVISGSIYYYFKI
jgi:hypothetical protein